MVVNGTDTFFSGWSYKTGQGFSFKPLTNSLAHYDSLFNRILQTVDRKYGKEQWKNNRMRETGLLVYKPFPGIYEEEDEENSEDEDVTDVNDENGSEESVSYKDDSENDEDGSDESKSDNRGEKKKMANTNKKARRPGWSVV